MIDVEKTFADLKAARRRMTWALVVFVIVEVALQLSGDRAGASDYVHIWLTSMIWAAIADLNGIKRSTNILLALAPAAGYKVQSTQYEVPRPDQFPSATQPPAR